MCVAYRLHQNEHVADACRRAARTKAGEDETEQGQKVFVEGQDKIVDRCGDVVGTDRCEKRKADV